jgi:hypothetical protein
MAEQDVEALALFIKYCEEEADRLALPATVVRFLTMAGEELTKSVAARSSTVIDDSYTKH